MIDGIVKEGHGQFCVTYYHNTDRVVPKVVEKWLRVQSQIPCFHIGYVTKIKAGPPIT